MRCDKFGCTVLPALIVVVHVGRRADTYRSIFARGGAEGELPWSTQVRIPPLPISPSPVPHLDSYVNGRINQAHSPISRGKLADA